MLTYFNPRNATLSRRALLFGSVAAAGCARRKGRGFAGYAFVANSRGNSVAAVDLSAFAVARQIGLEGAPSAILPHPSRAAVQVLMPEAGALCEIDATNMSITRKARLGAPALGMCPAVDGKSLWVLQSRALVQLDSDRLRTRRSIRLPGAAASFDLSRDGRAAVVLSGDRQLVMIRLDSGSIERVVPTTSEPSLVRFQSDGKQTLVASRADRSLTLFDSPTGRVAVRLPLPLEPVNLCFTSDGGQLFITGPGMDAVVIVFPYNTEVSETILAGRSPDGMAVTATPAYLFVANPQSGSVTILDIDTRKLVAVLAVGQQPRHILITPDNQYALVLNQQSGDMAVVRIASIRGRRHRNDPPPLFTMIPVGEQPVSAAVVAVG